MNQVNQELPVKKNYRILLFVGVIIMLVVGVVAGSAAMKVGRQQKSPELKALEAHLEKDGIRVMGGLVRRERTGVVYKAIYFVQSDSEKRSFIIEKGTTDDVVAKWQKDIYVNPKRSVRNGTLILHLADTWDSDNPLAEKLKKSFLDFQY